MVYALNHRQYGGRIVPVLKQPCDYEKLSWTLGAFQFVDFTKGFREGCRELLRAWGVPLNQRIRGLRLQAGSQ